MSSSPSGSLTVAVNTTDSPSVIVPTLVENERKKGPPSLDVVVPLLVEATPDVSGGVHARLAMEGASTST